MSEKPIELEPIVEDGYKVCSECGNMLPKTNDYFSIREGSRDGFRGQCKECRSKKQRQYHKENSEEILKRAKKYRQDHNVAISNQRKIYRANNKEILSQRDKKYYYEHREYVLSRVRRYLKGNKELIRLKRADYRFNHKEQCNILNMNYRSKKKQLPSTLTVEQWENIKLTFDNKCAYCGKELPLAKEHFIPVSKDGEFTHNNIIPSCRSCNSSKFTNDPFVWYPKQPFYSKSRESKILNHLNYDKKLHIQQLMLF